MTNSPEESPVLNTLRQTFDSLLATAREQGASEETISLLRANNAEFYNFLMFSDGRFDLPNRNAFYKTAAELIETNRNKEYGCILFNIRDFHRTNQILGPDVSNTILENFLSSLKNKLSEDEYLFAEGQDDGVILCKTDHVEKFLEYLQCARVEYDSITHETYEVRCAVGCNRNIGNISVHFMVMESVSIPLKMARADKARGTWCVFWDESIGLHAWSQALIEDSIPRALKDEEFAVYFQPKVNLKTYTLAGAEALCRWKHNDKLIYPDEFIPVMERNGTIGELDFYMLEHTCRHLRRWLDIGLQPVQVSVNLSRVNIGTESLIDRIIRTVDVYNVPHNFIQIELTETTTDVGFAELKELMEGLHDAGFSMAIDDFGTGYSSMSIIRNLPWNVIKIDKSLLHEHTDPSQDRHLMFKSITHMVQTLGLEAIVEGVESLDDITLLKENDCYLAQGYYFDKPLPADIFEQRLRTVQE